MNIPDLYEMSAGTVLESITGTLASCFERKSGIRRKGKQEIPWSLQNGLLKDQQGNKIPVQFNDCETDFLGWKNRTITIRSKDRGHGLKGIVLIDDTYDNKRKIQVREQAEIVGAGQNGHQQQRVNSPSRQEPPPREPADMQAPSTQQRTQTQRKTRAEKWASVRGMAIQIAHMHLIIQDVLDTYFEPQYEAKFGKKMDEEIRRGMVTNLAIEMEKQKAWIDLPSDPFLETRKPTPAPAAKAPPKPEPEPEPAEPDDFSDIDDRDDIPF